MNELLEMAFERVRTLPPERQEEAARVLFRFAGDNEPVYRMTPEEEASLANSRAQAARREFATEGEVRAVWAQYGL